MIQRILKKDMKRRKSINFILFLFITIASVFLSSSVNNILAVTSAVDYYLDYANVPDVNLIAIGTDEKEEIDTYCGQDADSDGVEGKYYLFTQEEVFSILGKEDGEEFCKLYDISRAGNFEGESIPNRIGQTGFAWDGTDERLKKLYEYRRKRTQLHRDDKVIICKYMTDHSQRLYHRWRDREAARVAGLSRSGFYRRLERSDDNCLQ